MAAPPPTPPAAPPKIESATTTNAVWHGFGAATVGALVVVGGMTKPSEFSELVRRPSVVLVCVNRRLKMGEPSCAAGGSEAIADAMEAGIRTERIDVKLERSICMGQCTKGPTVRFAPGGRFNLPTRLSDVPALVAELKVLCGVKPADDGPPLLHLLGS